MDQLQIRGLGDLHPSRLELRAEISRLEAAGYNRTAIVRSLNARRIPTLSGRGQWHHGTLRRFVDPYARERWNAYIRRYRAG